MPVVLKTQLFSGDLFKIPQPSTVLLKIEVTSTNSLWPAALRTGNELQAWIVEAERVMNNCTLLNTGIPYRLKEMLRYLNIFSHLRNSYELKRPSRIAFTSVLLPSKLFHPHDLFINGIVFSITKPATKGWPTKWTCKQQAAKKRMSPAARFSTYIISNCLWFEYIHSTSN